MNYTDFLAKATQSLTQSKVDLEHFYLQLGTPGYNTYVGASSHFMI